MIDFLTEHSPVIGLLFFFGFFCGVTVWLLKPSVRRQMQHNARIPLMEEDHGQS